MKKVDIVDSTNKYIKEHLIDFDNFDSVYSPNQTEGKGRGNHTWISEPNKNVAFSMLINDSKYVKKFNLISILTGIVIANYLEGLGLQKVALKWPNDVYVNGKKICGILLEGNLPHYLIIGVGINVNQTNFGELEATSIKNELGFKIDPPLVAVDVADLLKDEIKALDVDLIDYVGRYEELDYLANKTISFNHNNQILEGVALGINPDGSLKVKVNNEIISVLANEVNIVREKE